MAISYVGGKVAGTAGQGGGSIAINSGLTGGSGSAAAAGDLVVVTVSVGTAARQPTIAISTPSGYTPLTVQRTTSTTYDTNVQTCYKIMGSTPDTAVTIPASGNNADGIAYTIQVFRGVSSTTPMDTTATYATGTGVDNLPDGAAITPVTSGAWIVVCGGGAAAAGGTYAAAALTNFLTANGPDTNDGNVGSGYYTGWTSGAYDPAKFTGGSVNAANSWGCTTIALRPFVAVTHDTTGALTSQGATVVGSAARTRVHATTGALTGQGSVVVGSAARTRAHPASGVLSGQGAIIAGAAARTPGHPTSGALAGQGSIIIGAATNFRAFGSSGALTGQGSFVSGAANRTHEHPSAGALEGQGASIVGAADRASPGSPTHATTGSLGGPGAVITGTAIVISSGPPQGGGASSSTPAIRRDPKKGWANERAALEYSLEVRQAQAIFEKSPSKIARRIARKIVDYSQEAEKLSKLNAELDKLRIEYENNIQLKEDLQQAAEAVQDFVKDEQDAIDLFFLIENYDASILLSFISPQGAGEAPTPPILGE